MSDEVRVERHRLGLVQRQYGQAGCDLCEGYGHIVEVRRIVGSQFEVEIRPFDVDTEQRPDDGEVWVCPNCFWADQGTTDPLKREPSWEQADPTFPNL